MLWAAQFKWQPKYRIWSWPVLGEGATPARMLHALSASVLMLSLSLIRSLTEGRTCAFPHHLFPHPSLYIYSLTVRLLSTNTSKRLPNESPEVVHTGTCVAAEIRNRNPTTLLSSCRRQTLNFPLRIFHVATVDRVFRIVAREEAADLLQNVALIHPLFQM